MITMAAAALQPTWMDNDGGARGLSPLPVALVAGSFGTPIISPPPYPWYHNVEGTDRAWGHVGHGAFFALSGYVLQL